MPHDVMIGDELMALARREAELRGRSVSEQLGHWMRVGRAAETAGLFDFARIDAALGGALSPEDLTPAEHVVWLESLSDALAQPSDGERTHFEERKRLGLGVGLSDDGRIVREPGPS